MGHIQTYASVLSTEGLTTHLKQDREKWRAMFHTCIKLFTSTPLYVCINYVSSRIWSTPHIAQISQEQDRHNTCNHENNVSSLLPHQWLRCNSCTWAHDEQSCNGTSCAKGMICHIAIVVAGMAHCFHDCINLVLRAILKNSSLSSYSEKMRWGRRFITIAQPVNLFI